MRRYPLLVLVSLVLSGILQPGDAAAGAGAEPPDPVGVWPLTPEPRVVGAFEPPDVRWAAGHRGVDLAGSPGRVVSAALPGRVAFAGSVAGKPVVSVDHGGTRTTYEPVVATVQRGDRVAAGDPIGVLVLPGTHCPPAACLHWGWRRGKEYLDPLLLVGAVEVRLLPLWREEPADAIRPAGEPDGMPFGGGPW